VLKLIHMSSNPPIVPSRNALRVLRRLAYGGSTVIGAVGSLFTVAGISYDTQRRVHLAERLIETKRTIRSVSNSNGAAHVARMFEAAEKGEDFGLETTRLQRRHARREYASLGTMSAEERTLAKIASVRLHHQLVGDKDNGGGRAENVSLSGKKSATPIQGPTRIRPISLSSPAWANGLSQEPPTRAQRQFVQERSRKTATYHQLREARGHGKALKELPQTDAPHSGKVLVESYPTTRDREGTRIRKGGKLINDRPDTLHGDKHLSRDSGEHHSAVERMLASTQQNHKLHDYGIYGRHREDTLIPQEEVDVSNRTNRGPTSNSSAAEKIVAATQQQHKLQSHTVYGRPGKFNSEAHSRLNEHVALWLGGDGVSRRSSGPTHDYGSQAGPALGGGSTSKRPGSMFPEDSMHFQPVRRNLSTVACIEDTISKSLQAGTPSHRQKYGRESSTKWQSLLAPANDDYVPLSASEMNRAMSSDGRYAPILSERRSRGDRTLYRPRRHSHHSLFSSKERTTTSETDNTWRSDKPNVPASKQSRSPITLDLSVKPWPVSVSDVDVPEDSFKENFRRRNLQSNVTDQRQLSEANVVSDLSDQSLIFHSQKSIVQGDPSCLSGARPDPDEAFEECVIKSTTEGYNPWDRFIRAALEVHGKPAARQLWLKAMAYYATPGPALNWDLVNDLHKHFHHKFWPAVPPYLDFDPARLLTRHVLEAAPTSQRAAELVFPLLDKETELEAEYAAQGRAYPAAQRSRNLFANAGKYLKDLWEEGQGVEKILVELRKLIRIAKMQNIELAEPLFCGTIRRLSSNGLIEQAQALFDEMVYYHRVKPSFSTRSVLVCGHARAGDWDRVAKEIEAMHNVHDLSRREPLGYSLMFNDVLAEYASRRSVAQTHDFLVHALGYWGLVPTSAISATAIQAFLTHKRFDLVREWVETVRILFPQVDTETSRFAWHLGSVWEDINASCLEVEEACRALCYRKDPSKVQASLREMVRLALARDLAAKLHAAEAAEASNERPDHVFAGSPWALTHFLERAQSFAPGTSSAADNQPVESKEARELLSQLESVARLDKFFGTAGKFTDPLPLTVHHPSQSPSQKTSGPASGPSLQSHVPPELTRDVLPSRLEVERLLGQYYAARQKDGLAISHDVLKYTCQKLRKHDRRVDAMQILKTILDGPYVRSPSGVMFDLSIMEMWLRFAYETKSLSHCLTIFWAVLDAGEDYVLTSKFVLLANMSLHRLRHNRFDALARSNPSKHEELQYLMQKLRRKLWANNEVAGSAVDKTRSAEYRKVRSQMRRRLIVSPRRTVEVSG
jgi:hypothetical protein